MSETMEEAEEEVAALANLLQLLQTQQEAVESEMKCWRFVETHLSCG